MIKREIKKRLLKEYPDAVPSSVSITNIKMHPFENNLIQSFNFRFNECDYIFEIVGNKRIGKTIYKKVSGSFDPQFEWVRIYNI